MNTQENLDQVLIGMGGWEIPSFNSVFYPAKPEKGFRKLEYFSHFFDLVEVNATFYNNSISQAQASRWLGDVRSNPNFMFTVKLYRGFTHSFNGTKNDILAIHQILEPLRKDNKLGGIVAQFSSSFEKTKERETYLTKLRDLFPDDRLFLDMRHRSWDQETFYQFCTDQNLYLANVDLPRLKNHMPFNSLAHNGVAYFRLMGRNAQNWNNFQSGDRYLYNYSEEELKDLFQRIKQLNAKKIFVVFHNDRQAFSLVNGRQLEHAVHPQKNLKAPIRLLSAFSQLKPFCEPATTENNLFTSLPSKMSES